MSDAETDSPYQVPIEPVLDLHAFQPRDITSVVEEYLHAAHEAGLREVRLIHGRGKGIQRGMVQAVLESNPLVESFHDAPESHLGATVAALKSQEVGGWELETGTTPISSSLQPPSSNLVKRPPE